MEQFDTDYENIITLEDYVKQENECQEVFSILKSSTPDTSITNEVLMNYPTSSSDNITSHIRRSSATTTVIFETNNQTDDLKLLLSKWKLDCLLEYFQSERIDINILKIMKPNHVERLLQKFPLGTQILFEHCLEKWKSDMFHQKPTTTIKLSNPTSLPSKHTCPSSVEPSPQGLETQNAARYNTPTIPLGTIILKDILKASVKGKMLMKIYNKIGQLDDEQRNILIDIIYQYFHKRNIHMSLGTSYRLETEICKTFPTEKLEFYRNSKRGKLYNRCCNMTMKEKKKKEPKINPIPEINPTKVIISEVNKRSSTTSFEFENLSTLEFEVNWKESTQNRLIEMSRIKCSTDILKKWPYYKNPFGYRLIDMDFDVLFQNKSNIVNRWNQYSSKISDFLSKDCHIKNKNIKEMLNVLKYANNISENGQNAVLLWALHGYLIPTQKIVTFLKGTKGKKTIIKYRIVDSQAAFILLGSSLQELDDHVKSLTSKSSNSQPFIMAIGENILRINEIYVYFDGTKFLFTSFLKAVDICYKIFHLFKLKYPLAATNFYTFIESCFYEMQTVKSSKFTKISILLNEIISSNEINH